MEVEAGSACERQYQERKILVSVSEAESLRRDSSFAHEGLRDIYPYRPLKYQTLESLARIA